MSDTSPLPPSGCLFLLGNSMLIYKIFQVSGSSSQKVKAGPFIPSLNIKQFLQNFSIIAELQCDAGIVWQREPWCVFHFSFCWCGTDDGHGGGHCCPATQKQHQSTQSGQYSKHILLNIYCR